MCQVFVLILNSLSENESDEKAFYEVVASFVLDEEIRRNEISSYAEQVNR